MKLFLLASLFFVSSIFGDLTSYFKKIEHDHAKEKPIEQIDYIYLINLDQRPEKLEKMLAKLLPYGIEPFRFPAIYGWDLSIAAINDIGLKYKKGMLKDHWVWQYTKQNDGDPELEFLREELYGNTFYSFNMNPGAMGCTLSHLSVLQNAYDAGYQTIWILEDDVIVNQDPQILNELIKNLDALIGKKGWDVLYTDTDMIDACWYDKANDLESDLVGNLHFLWRPDSDNNSKHLRKRTILNENFVQIGSRMHTHSMIIRRSGMKKILDFEKKHRPFCPYDNELAFVPNLKCINLRYDVVTAPPAESDTRVDRFSKRAKWKAYVEESLEAIPTILGWRNPQKAHTIMNFIHKTQPQTVVEIGCFGGAISYPIAKALAFQKSGTLYAIDAWNIDAACHGLKIEQNIGWWKKIDFESIYQSFLQLLDTHQLKEYCFPIRKLSKDAVSSFNNESIDILIIDGNPSTEGCFADVSSYLPKVKKGGYIWINEANADEKQPSIEHLLKYCEWIKEEALGSSFALFQKSKTAKRKI